MKKANNQTNRFDGPESAEEVVKETTTTTETSTEPAAAEVSE